MLRTLYLTLCGLLLTPALLRADDPLLLGGDPSVDPNDFRITEFATGLNYPISMAPLDDGSLLVATSRPAQGNFFDSTGELVRLFDANHDGVADAAPQVLYTGLVGGLTGMRRAGNLVFATSVKTGYNGISVLRAGATPDAPLTLLGNLDFTYPAGWEHVSFTLATRPTFGQADQYDLAFNVGSEFNAAPTAGSASMSGLASGELFGDSIYLTTIHDTGSKVEFGAFTQVAKGLRNAAGIEFDPQSGALVFQDNGIDGLVNSFIPLSADELNVLPANQLGGDVEDYGFPNNYYEYNTGNFVGGKGEPSAVVFQPWPDPQTGSKSEGAFEIAIAPPDFPAGLNHGVFVGFHGNSGNANNDENPLVYADPETGKYFHIVSSDAPNVGHLNGLEATQDSLFVADMSRSGSIFAGAGQGVIYQIKSLVAGLPGDVDGNLQVDLSDFGILKANFGAATGRRQGDLTLDGKIDLSDFGVLKANFGRSSPAPEPSTWLLLMMGATSLAALRVCGPRLGPETAGDSRRY